MPKPSGDYFSNLSASLDYSYTEFDDNILGTYGQFHDSSVSLYGTIAEDTDLSTSFNTSERDSSVTLGNKYQGEMYGGDLMLIHKLNDNYGLEIYGFYQHSDHETLDTRDYGSGMGTLLCKWHDLGWFEVSTVNSVNKTYYEAENDTLFN